MKMGNILKSIYGSSARVDILKVLYTSIVPLSGRQIGELAGLTHKGAISAMESLVDLGVVELRKAGPSYQYLLSRKNILTKKIIIPNIKAESGLLDDLNKDINRHFGKHTVSIILFGSLARGDEDNKSDIDVLAVTRDEKEKKIVEELMLSQGHYYFDKFNSPLALICYTLDELKSKKELSLIKNTLKEGNVIKGKPLEELIQ